MLGTTVLARAQHGQHAGVKLAAIAGGLTVGGAVRVVYIAVIPERSCRAVADRDRGDIDAIEAVIQIVVVKRRSAIYSLPADKESTFSTEELTLMRIIISRFLG